MSKSQDILFEARMPLGSRVQVMRDYWVIITSINIRLRQRCGGEERAQTILPHLPVQADCKLDESVE